VVASGSVNVAADVPVNTSILSVEPAVVLLEKEVYFVDNDPLTSNVELGVVVPIPICAFVAVASREINNNRKRCFIAGGFVIVDFMIKF
jgi:hypothetical protein